MVPQVHPPSLVCSPPGLDSLPISFFPGLANASSTSSNSTKLEQAPCKGHLRVYALLFQDISHNYGQRIIRVAHLPPLLKSSVPPKSGTQLVLLLSPSGGQANKHSAPWYPLTSSALGEAVLHVVK